MTNLANAPSSLDIHNVLFQDIATFAMIMLPDYFTCSFGEFHQEIFDLWDSDEEYVMLVMPRGWGKTTLLQMLMMREGVYQRSKFTLFISDTNDQAEEKLEAMKEEFSTNEIHRYGDQRSENSREIRANCFYSVLCGRTQTNDPYGKCEK